MADNQNKCSTCQRTPSATEPPLLRCSRCKNHSYCSKECQRHDWPSHKKQCTEPIGYVSTPGGQQRAITYADVIGGFNVRKDGEDLRTDMHPDAIFPLQIHWPFHTALRCTIQGPYTMKEAFFRANREVLTLRNVHTDSDLTSFIESTDRMVRGCMEDGKKRKTLAGIKKYRIPLRNGKIYSIRRHAERNPEVAKMWRDVRAGRVVAGPTYFAWTSDGDCRGQAYESTVERDVLATFTSMEAATLCATENLRKMQEGGGGEGEDATTEVAKKTLGVLRGAGMKADGSVLEP